MTENAKDLLLISWNLKMILEMEFMEVSIMHHIGLIFMLLWLLSCFNLCNAVAYFASLFYLYSVISEFSFD